MAIPMVSEKFKLIVFFKKMLYMRFSFVILFGFFKLILNTTDFNNIEHQQNHIIKKIGAIINGNHNKKIPKWQYQ
ncbi:MAG: hypothetical protein Q8844_02120, partial [Pigeon pea little leaf phytoplasma]|nr:hypothetical protein [Pigeon pea little leaf phytoplasma]